MSGSFPNFSYWNEMLFQKIYRGHRAQWCGGTPLFGNANAMRRSFIWPFFRSDVFGKWLRVDALFWTPHLLKHEKEKIVCLSFNCCQPFKLFVMHEFLYLFMFVSKRVETALRDKAMNRSEPFWELWIRFHVAATLWISVTWMRMMWFKLHDHEFMCVYETNRVLILDLRSKKLLCVNAKIGTCLQKDFFFNFVQVLSWSCQVLTMHA